MSSIQLPSNMGAAKVDTYQRLDGANTVDLQVVVPGNPFSATTGTITGTGQSVPVSDLQDAGSVLIAMTGTFSFTGIFEGSINGTDWLTVAATRVESNTAIAVATSFTAAAAYKVNTNGFNYVRLRSTAYVSGTANIAIQPSPHAVENFPYVPLISTLTRQVGYTDSSTNLAGAATFTGTGRASLANYTYFNATAFADQAGTLFIDLSVDTGTTYRQIRSVAVAANVAQTLVTPLTGLAGTATLYRVRYTNGATAQGAFQLTSSYTAA
jgi:hypothetical protein